MKNNKVISKRTKDIIFCLLILAIPAIQFSIFYLGVNINSLVMVFQKYEVNSETLQGAYVFNGLKNFSELFNLITNEGIFGGAIRNSLIVFVVITFFGITFSLFFSLYIFKKMPFSKIFRVLLFAPSILSAVVMVTMFKYFVEGAIPAVLGMKTGLLSNPDTKFATIVFYNIWIGFGMQILMYSGAMSGIDASVMEAAKLDGVSPLREFFSIIIPLIFPTIQTFIITGVAQVLINQINLVAFDGLWATPKYITVGYYLFSKAEAATAYELPVLATFGVILTLIAAPITLLTRWALDKFGPSVD